MKNIFSSLVEWFLAGSKLGVNETLSRHYRDFIETLSGHYREKNHYLATKFAATFLMLLTLGVGQMWGASVAEGTYNFVDQTINAKTKFYKIDNGIYQYRLNAYTKNSSLGIQLPAPSGDGTGFVFHLESTQKVYIGIVKKSVKAEVVNNLYIKTITEANFSAFEAGSNNSTVTLTLAGSATLSQNYTFAAIGTAKTEGATIYMGELPAGYYYAYGNSTGGNGNLYSISFGTQTLFLVPNDKTSDNAKFAIYYWMGTSGYERQGWSDYMTVSPCNSSTYRADIPKGYTKVIFVRLNPSGGINWDSKWNQTGNLTFDGSKDLFTWAKGSWEGATTTWSASTKYTISFAANGGSGSMSNVSSIACGRSVTLAANAYTKSGYVFAGWKTNVAVTANGSSVAANGIVADGATISNITSNITLTAQWEEDIPAGCTAPTALSVGSVTADGATFTVTDGASTNNYEFYYSTSSTAPTAGTAATTSVSCGSSKSVTGLTANSTYYAWVRSVCAVDNKSAWVAATPATFTTLSSWYLKGSFDSWGSGSHFTGDGTTVETSLSLAADTRYEIKINNGPDWYGHSNTHIGGNVSDVTFYTSGGNHYNCNLLTTTAGTYTFSFNTSTKALTVTYPNSYKVYYKNTGSWGTIYAYKFTSKEVSGDTYTGNAGAWPGATVSTYEEICGERYYYIYTDGYANVIFTNNSGQQTGDMPAASGDGKFVAGTENAWRYFGQCGLEDKYTLHTGVDGEPENTWTVTPFSSDGSATGFVITNYEIPSTPNLYVGWQGEFQDNRTTPFADDMLGTECSSSEMVGWADTPVRTDYGSFHQWQGQPYLSPVRNGDNLNYYPVGQATGAKGTIKIYEDSKDRNLYIHFIPDGYGIKVSDGTMYPFANVSSTLYETDAYTIADVSQTFFMGLKKAGDDYAKCGKSPTTDAALSTIKIVNTSTSIANGAVGKFRMWNDSSATYWGTCFVPCYVLTYDANGGTGTTEHQYVETSAGDKNVTVRANGFTAPTGYKFAGWATSDARADAGIVDYLPGATYNLNAQTTLYAVWAGAGYTFHSATSGDYPWPSTNFTQVGSSHVWQITNYTIPSTTQFYVGAGGVFMSDNLGEGDAHGNHSASVAKLWTDVPTKSTAYDGAMFVVPSQGVFYLEPSNYALGQATGAVGTLLITDTVSDKNLYVRFKPDGYGLTYNSKSLPFTYAGENYIYETALVTLDASDISAANFKVGLQTGTAGTYADCSSHSVSESAATIGGRSGSTTPVAGSRGKFRIWDDSAEDNWFLMFIPVFTITYDCDGAESGCPSNAVDQTNLPNPLPSAPTKSGYIFDGWFTDAGKTVAAVAGAALTENTTLYAKWYLPPSATVYNFSNGNFHDWGNCAGGNLTLTGSQLGVSYQLYKDDVASGDPKAGTGSNLVWHVTVDGVYTVRSVASASYSETAMNGSADVQIQDPTLSGPNKVKIGETITLTHPGYLIAGDNWVSSNTSVATVSSSGVVTGVSIGTATITFHGVTGCDGTMVVTVNDYCYEFAPTLTSGSISNDAEIETSVGGTMTKLGGTINYTTDGLSFESSSSSKVSVTLDGKMQAGSVITIEMYIHTTSSRGFKIANSSGTVKATFSESTIGTYTRTYTVVAGDGIAGSSEFQIHRNNNAYLKSVTVSGCEPPHTVTYKANGGAGADVVEDDAKTIAANTFTAPTAYTFDSWNTAADGSGETYNVGDAVSSDLILFAQWVCAEVTASATAANGTAAQTYNKGDAAGAMTATGGTIFQWYRSSEDNIRSATRTIMEGQTSATLTPSTAVFGTTYYFCAVSNACGNKDTTNTVAITIEDPNPAPTADWTGTTTSPTHGGGGYTVTVVAKNYDASALWDGTLTEAMLSASDGITLSGITVNNTTKTITATYGVTAAAETPITFTLSLPATATHKAADLTYDVAFTECAGGGANTILFLSETKDDSDNNLGQINTGSSCIVGGGVAKLMTGSSNAKLNAAANKYGYRCDPNYLIVVFKFEATTDLTIMHNANSTGGRYMQLYKFSSAKALSEITSSDWSSKTVQAFTSTSSAETWGGGGTSSVTTNGANTTWNYGTKGCLSVTWEDLSEGYYVLIGSGSLAYLYGFSYESEIGGGSLATTLAWSNSQADGATLQKGEYDADFTVTANRSNAYATASLGAISYASSDESVATVNAATGRVSIADNIDFGGAEYKTTTITATLAASGCYQRAQVTYILRVNKQECEDAEGVIASTNLGCAGVLLTLSGYSAGATIAWYKDDAVIPGETGSTYTATSAGSYYATTTLTGAGHCTMTSNTVVIEDVVLSATAIVDQWYIKNTRRTPDIELVATQGATSFIVKSGSTVIWNSDGSVSTGFGGCEFYMDANGTIYLKGEKADGSATTGLTAGDETLTFYVSGCGDADPVNIVIHKQTTPVGSIAFIVDGDKDGAVSDVDASKTTSRPIWTYLSSYYTLTGCNAYWTNDEKTLREYYSQYDAILITDDPDTGIKPSSGKAYVNALGTMVDVRPLLTLEAFVGKYGASSNWHIGATPHSPKPRQYEMKLQCKDHTIFNSLTTEPLPDNVRMVEEDGIEYYYVTMVDRTHSTYSGLGDNTDTDDKPALQGFENSVIPGVLGVGTINDNTYGTLRGGVERQEEPAARMIILGIQHQAMAALTPQGKLVIKQALDYLLLTNMDDVDDCSNYFIGGTAGHETDWHTGTNWTAGHVPDKTVTARILAPCTVSGATKASAAAVDIVTGGRTTRYKSGASDCEGTLTIQPTGILVSDGRILQIAEAPHFVEGSRVPTTPAILKVEANGTNTGALIFDNEAGTAQATVEMYVPSHWEVDGATGKKKKYWSYIGVPIKNVDIPNYFYLGFTYYYDETASGAWVKRGDGTVLQPFEGIGASMKTAGKEIFTGTLASTETQEITLTKTTAGGNGENLIGNSWTAPIQIAAFTASDFGDATQTVFVYNSGRDDVYQNPTYVTADADNDGAATAGQWVGVPIGVAGLGGYTGLKVIPAMNAFQINTASETTLTLDYDKLVRPATYQVNAPLRAQKRNTAEANEIDGLLRVRVTGEKTHTDVWLLQDARFDYGFDNGWEAGYQDCDDRSSQLYAVSEIGRMAFLAQPDIDGTVLGFAPSRDGDEYTFSFHYLGDEVLYLNDLKQQTSTLVSDENIYRFTYEEGDTNRFIISATPFGSPSVTTGNEEVLHPDRVKKVVYRDHVYIIRGGKIYDVIGKIVR